jgi:hypothetical protein
LDGCGASELSTRCPYTGETGVEVCLRAQVVDLTRQRDEARRMLGECFVLSGADTDGDGWEHNWPHAVEEVRTLRRQLDEPDAVTGRLAHPLPPSGAGPVSMPGVRKS